uniref:TBC1 domain family member 10B-like n=1 Tax=Phascolarctos cinereus TaxID=38626 RepID=A0A6P5M336_PHACI|nr:TBC1 domain family member 10B-like [Phascolarctos cinereus]
METGPAPLVAPPRRHGASVAPSPPPRGSRAGPVLVVAPGPPVTTATSSPVTLVAPGEARPAWVSGGPRPPPGIPGSRPPPSAPAGSPGPAGGHRYRWQHGGGADSGSCGCSLWPGS